MEVSLLAVPGTQTLIIEPLIEVASLHEIADLIVVGHHHKTHRVLLLAERLPAGFFDLSTGIAGEVVQKFVNYRFCVACVINNPGQYGERFKEFALEAREGQQFRTFVTRESAFVWLSGQF